MLNKMLDLTLQCFLNAQWHDMATLSFDDKSYEFKSLSYLPAYALEYMNKADHYACSIHYPVALFQDYYGYAYFLDDIIPAGASRKYWVNALNLKHLDENQQNYELLKYGAIAPIGHLRIKDAYENIPKNDKIDYYTIKDVNHRNADFLEYCCEQGTIISGATGAGGDAPKILIRLNPNHQKDKCVWIDNQQLGNTTDEYYLVKYPRGKKTPIDCDILRAEYCYYQELSRMGFNTIDTQNMKLYEGEKYPALWLPRFDVFYDEQNNFHRYAMESVYSLLKKNAGAYLRHEECIKHIIQLIQQTGLKFDTKAFIIEWVRRDLLNIAFDNRDNHGRNTAFLRWNNTIQLAPIYDFAPMKLDPVGISRSTKWDTNAEKSGSIFYFKNICTNLEKYIDPTELHHALQQTALQLIDLKSNLKKQNCPESILNQQGMAFENLPEKLKAWELLP